MKQIISALILCSTIAWHGTAQEVKPEATQPPTAYVGKLPDNDEFEILVEHKAIATFQDVIYRLCYGQTGGCPESCGSSGEFARFNITDYLIYNKLGTNGGDMKKSYHVHTTDYYRKPKGDPSLEAYINTFKAGDLAVIEWKHITNARRPLLLLEKIDKAEAKRLIEAKLAAETLKKKQHQQGLHLTQEAFLKRLRILDPKQFSNLKGEELSKLTKLHLEDRVLSEDDFLCIAKWMPALECLHLRLCVFPKASLNHLTKLKHLVKLYLPYCYIDNGSMPQSDIGDDSILFLSKLTALKCLNLQGSEITDDGMKVLGKLENLAYLKLADSDKIEGHGFEHLIPLKNLKKLDLEYGVKDESFKYLAKITSLEDLRLRYCKKFSLKSLDHLKSLKKLKFLDLCYSLSHRDNTSEVLTTVASFQKALPNCYICCQMDEIKKNQDQKKP